jgi:hypothetical protein
MLRSAGVAFLNSSQASLKHTTPLDWRWRMGATNSYLAGFVLAGVAVILLV